MKVNALKSEYYRAAEQQELAQISVFTILSI